MPASGFQVILIVFLLPLPLPLHPRGDAEADFLGVALGVEGEKAGEHFIAKVGRLEQAGLIGGVVLVAFVEEDGRGARGKVAPAIGFEHGRPWRRAARPPGQGRFRAVHDGGSGRGSEASYFALSQNSSSCAVPTTPHTGPDDGQSRKSAVQSIPEPHPTDDRKNRNCDCTELRDRLHSAAMSTLFLEFFDNRFR
jgi:hypothetical protein